MKAFITAIIVAGLTLGLMSTSQAAVVDTSVIVEDRSQRVRAEAITQAFEQVLRSRTGNTGMLDESLAALLTRSSQFVDNYAYSTNEEGFTQLDIRFQERKLRQALVEANVAYWPDQRSKTLVLLAQVTTANRSPQYLGDDEPLMASMNDAFIRYDLEMITPIWDLEDRIIVSPQQIWAHDRERAVDLATKYGASCVLTGAAYLDSQARYRISWSLDCAGEFRRRQLGALDVEGAANQGRNLVVSQLVAQQAVDLSGEPQALSVAVAGLQDYPSVTALRSYLDELLQVQSYRIQSISPAGLQVELSLVDELSKFRQRLQRDGKLQRIDDEHYQWVAMNVE
ncbi:DUF2066 domain-containing protein [Umboniibacter marinipuniceus]|uniref:DUF2066 domain-containing protein n=1 Tax=Umboniibacter marinipuniceus TaxID=569599 RepID=A0A3M0A8F2_9GAMM|nr:DUF2066 domain-containing protein [Umboniibacter marinipuniceus]RMA81383.1 hypothetical protein DFR27_1203 [Umboniibacter marinipuniceus]